MSHIPYAQSFKCALLVLIFGPTLHWISHNCLSIYHYYIVLKNSKKQIQRQLTTQPHIHLISVKRIRVMLILSLTKAFAKTKTLWNTEKYTKSLFESLSFTLKQLELIWAMLRRDRNKGYYYNMEGACVECFTMHETCSYFVWTSVAMSYVNFQARNIS